MRIWTMKELFRLTRSELFTVRYEILAELARMPEASGDRGVALANLENIRRVLARLDPRPS